MEAYAEPIVNFTTSISKYKGYLNMTLKFNNNFMKEALYVILNYKYVDNYDSKFYFKAKLKLFIYNSQL